MSSGTAATFASTIPPGLRRRSRIEEKLEKLSVADALNAMRFAEVVIVLMDSQAPFEEQDLRIADLVEREGRARRDRHEQMGPGGSASPAR